MDSGRFRILKIPSEWQYGLFSTLRSIPNEEFHSQEWRNPGPHDNEVRRRRLDYRSFLREFLPQFYQEVGIDAVLSAAINYIQDFDWGAISHETGFPYLVLHRENLTTSPGHEHFWTERARSFKSFHGTHLLLHNEVMARIFIDAGYVEPERVSAPGCIRMDEYIEAIQKGETERGDDERPRVTLFSFFHGAGIFHLFKGWSPDGEEGYLQLFQDVHAAMAELAAQNPEVEFVVKTKWKDGWFDRIEDAIREAGFEPDGLPNLRLTDSVDAHELIFDSDVVLSFGSTTLLEAAIAGRPVIFPDFAETNRPEYRDYLHFKDELHIFDVAESKEHLKQQVLDRLQDPEIPVKIMEERYRLFEKYVSSIDADATQQYADTIEAVIREHGQA